MFRNRQVLSCIEGFGDSVKKINHLLIRLSMEFLLFAGLNKVILISVYNKYYDVLVTCVFLQREEFGINWETN